MSRSPQGRLLLGCLLLSGASTAYSMHTCEHDDSCIAVASSPLMVANKTAARNEQEAAAQATRRHGGKVLRVQRQGDHFEVRLLLDSGRIKHVTIPANRSGNS